MLISSSRGTGCSDRALLTVLSAAGFFAPAAPKVPRSAVTLGSRNRGRQLNSAGPRACRRMGLMPIDANLRILDYDPDWPRRATEAIDALNAAAPGLFAAIEHIGSTAVPGLAAKPIIDLMAAMPDLELARPQGQALAENGFRPHS